MQKLRWVLVKIAMIVAGLIALTLIFVISIGFTSGIIGYVRINPSSNAPLSCNYFIFFIKAKRRMPGQGKC